MSLFGKVTVIGIGLIGSSLARVIKRDGLARRISCYDVKPQYMQKALELGIVDEIHKNMADSVKNAGGAAGFGAQSGAERSAGG